MADVGRACLRALVNFGDPGPLLTETASFA